jgi:hypothetical protein
MCFKGLPSLTAVILVTSVAGGAPGVNAPSVSQIIQQSVDATRRDWEAKPNYNYYERDTDPSNGKSKTYEVLMLRGSPYQRLVSVNGKKLSPTQRQEEEEKLQQETAKRGKESQEQRARRIAGYEADRQRDHRMIEELIKAFDFKMRGTGSMDGHSVYIIDATPRAGYQPPDAHAKVLTGMKGTLWIDRSTFQWVKVEAHVIHTVSISGFLADVEPGTRFELEKMPIDGQIWLPKHFRMNSDVKILGVIPHGNADDETYFQYRRAGKSAPE